MCEKPMATNSADARAMLEAAEEEQPEADHRLSGTVPPGGDAPEKNVQTTANWEKSILPARTPCAAGGSQTGGPI